ncbi:MAG: GGDEF domain-containing protein [Limnothrix sp. RL_2_0]|nr:GGDEF domain-containing protein [Limnothrix sp. RL_2_0]
MESLWKLLTSPLYLKHMLDVGASVLLCLGFVVIFGWYIKSSSLVQLSPHFVPMQFNTALGFLLLGISLFALNNSRKAIATSCAAVIFLIVFLTLTQYLFKVDLLIDELLMDPYIVTATSHPGRMAPNTALNFCLSSFSILLMGRSKLTLPRLFFASISGGLVMGLGFVAMLGYLSNIETAYGWGRLTRMALHTSIGFVLTGALLIVAVKYLSARHYGRSPLFFLPVTVCILGFTVTIALWQAFWVAELTMKKQYTNADSNLVAESILIGGGVFSLVMASAVWYAEKFKYQLETLREAKTQILQLNQRLEQLSYSDALTGIANRRLFDLTIEKEWGRAYRDKSSLALIFIDIDCFKLYNDCYGHQQGDRCLQQVAEVLNSVARRSSDLTARYGGEEFVLLLPDTKLHTAQMIAQKALEGVRDLRISHKASPVSPIVTFSAGVYACIPEDRSAIAPFISKVDQALYEAKRMSRNRVVILPSA